MGKAGRHSAERVSNKRKMKKEEENLYKNNEEDLYNTENVNQKIEDINDINDDTDYESDEYVKGKKTKVIVGVIATILALAIIVVAIVVAFAIFGKKVKNEVQIELGSEEITLESFLENEQLLNVAEFVTDVSKIDLNEVATHEIIIKIKDKEYTSTLNIVDTTPPEVEFQDVEQYLNYVVNPEDFIVSKQDASEMEVYISEDVQTTEFAEHYIVVTVKDKYDNETSQECLLNISYIKSKYILEYGNQLTKADLIFDVENYENIISQEDIDVINQSGVGEYELTSTYEDEEKVIKISVVDTTIPTLVLKNASIYTGQELTDVNIFVEQLEDASEVTLNILTEIDYSIVGDQEVTIEAVDAQGNKTSRNCSFNNSRRY